MGYGRKERKVNDIPAAELKKIRKKERNYAKRKKTGNVANAKKIEVALSADLNRPLSKQECMQIEMGERQKDFMRAYYRYNGNVGAACAFIGIKRSTFNTWFTNCPELGEQINEVTEAMLDLAEQQLMKNIANGKENSLFFFLCNKGKGRGWQDVRKLAAPKIAGIHIQINHPPGNTGAPQISTKIVESKIIESDQCHTDKR